MSENTLNLQSYADKGIDYQQYLQDILKVREKSEAEIEFYEYYDLNLQRMQRLDKVIELSDNQLERLSKLNKKMTFIVITEGWCGDAAQILPVIEKMKQATKFIELKIVYRDENPELMQAYLTNGSMSIPIVIGVDAETAEELFHWGPRPEFGQELLRKFKNEEITQEEFHLNLQKAYNKDKGMSIVDELLLKLKL